MISSNRNRRRCSFASAAVALLILTGCAGNAPTQSVASPAAVATPTAALAQSGATVGLPEPEVLPASVPVSFRIPSVDAQSELLNLGLESDGSLEVPPDGPGAPAGWYNDSPTPGERGPAILLGHVNATGGGPGVFAELRALKAGDTVEVTRADGTTAVFSVDRGEQYSKQAFPTEKVYGNTAGSELRLITCDGYDPLTGEFNDNYVVYAKLAV
jgi:Sortase domain